MEKAKHKITNQVSRKILIAVAIFWWFKVVLWEIKGVGGKGIISQFPSLLRKAGMEGERHCS